MSPQLSRERPVNPSLRQTTTEFKYLSLVTRVLSLASGREDTGTGNGVAIYNGFKAMVTFPIAHFEKK